MTDPASIPEHVLIDAVSAMHDYDEPEPGDLLPMSAAIAAALDALMDERIVAVTDTYLEGQVAVPKAKVRLCDVKEAMLVPTDPLVLCACRMERHGSKQTCSCGLPPPSTILPTEKATVPTDPESVTDVVCSKCGRVATLAPVPGDPGRLSIVALHGWEGVPWRCPACVQGFRTYLLARRAD